MLSFAISWAELASSLDLLLVDVFLGLVDWFTWCFGAIFVFVTMNLHPPVPILPISTVSVSKRRRITNISCYNAKSSTNAIKPWSNICKQSLSMPQMFEIGSSLINDFNKLIDNRSNVDCDGFAILMGNRCIKSNMYQITTMIYPNQKQMNDIYDAFLDSISYARDNNLMHLGWIRSNINKNDNLQSLDLHYHLHFFRSFLMAMIPVNLNVFK